MIHNTLARYLIISSCVFKVGLRRTRCPEACKLGVGGSGQQVRKWFAARTPMFDCPPQHLKVPFISGALTRVLIPRAVVLPKPLQHLQVTARSGECTTIRL